eukprot:TRINITY_DN30918_c0_g1_i2.p1 TRINITY_DN30918_c0_g1~~TRINITY_DN30918_c0_g1_i2.p1  ORF type:complete len:162 (-),score=2.87 TRINITY_DN30918_c0_g1_i2:50-472(-)
MEIFSSQNSSCEFIFTLRLLQCVVFKFQSLLIYQMVQQLKLQQSYDWTRWSLLSNFSHFYIVEYQLFDVITECSVDNQNNISVKYNATISLYFVLFGDHINQEKTHLQYELPQLRTVLQDTTYGVKNEGFDKEQRMYMRK